MANVASTLTIKVQERASRDGQLEQATSLLREKAVDCGILVTRVDFTTFTIALSPHTPFGTTEEIDLLRGKC